MISIIRNSTRYQALENKCPVYFPLLSMPIIPIFTLFTTIFCHYKLESFRELLGYKLESVNHIITIEHFIEFAGIKNPNNYL